MPRFRARNVRFPDLSVEREPDLGSLDEERDDDGAPVDAQLGLVPADGDELDLLTHLEYRDPGASNATPAAHDGQLASSYVSSANDINDSYRASNRFSPPPRF